jgi:hypothetical protein
VTAETTTLTESQRQARHALLVEVITSAIETAPPGLSARFVAALVRTDLRAYGLFDHACDDLCGTEPDDHHVCGEDGFECDDECVCHGYSNDELADDGAEVSA